MMKLYLAYSVFAFFLCWQAYADTPANCSYEDIQGLWIFDETDPIEGRNEDCQNALPTATRHVHLKLDFPNVAMDRYGNVGTWTIIYNQGFEVVINYRKYFAFSLFQQRKDKVTSFCNATLPGWSHDVMGNNWACYRGRKVVSWETPHLLANQPPRVHFRRELLLSKMSPSSFLEQSYVDQINRHSSSWRATVYPQLQSKSSIDLIRMAGGEASRIVGRPKAAPVTQELRELTSQLPDSFDWRNVDGVNYVSPVRNQGSCGSCYTFASMAMLESRVRIMTNNSQRPVFSTQNVVDCSEYSQGCEGGFPYLIAGKYAQDFGVIEDRCYPYKGVDEKCSQRYNQSTECKKRTYIYNYHYVGGYYGACNEDLMRVELVRNGPIAVGFEVYEDFMSYKSGVYSHKNLKGLGFDPFELTNHAVLVVGYGQVKTTGEKYWIVKNSWGTEWGMNGYFWIRRGTDECGIESLAVAATPIPV